jgi:hypothetical protein
MNPISILILVAIIALTVWVGRVGMSSIREFFQKRIRQILGATLIISGIVLISRGAWQIAFIPATFGWWLFSSNASTRIGDLIKHYLDRSFPQWRPHLHDGTDTRNTRTSASSTIMTKEEAYQILGLEPSNFKFGQSREAITAAYRQAMKKAHPDQGGSSDLAVRLNLARDVLFAQHN